jgi:hypothetical protein
LIFDAKRAKTAKVLNPPFMAIVEVRDADCFLHALRVLGGKCSGLGFTAKSAKIAKRINQVVHGDR